MGQFLLIWGLDFARAHGLVYNVVKVIAGVGQDRGFARGVHFKQVFSGDGLGPLALGPATWRLINLGSDDVVPAKSSQPFLQKPQTNHRQIELQ